MTIIDNLHHPIPLQIKTNFYDEWIKNNSLFIVILLLYLIISNLGSVLSIS
jgi:hypothetical protein